MGLPCYLGERRPKGLDRKKVSEYNLKNHENNNLLTKYLTFLMDTFVVT